MAGSAVKRLNLLPQASSSLIRLSWLTETAGVFALPFVIRSVAHVVPATALGLEDTDIPFACTGSGCRWRSLEPRCQIVRKHPASTFLINLRRGLTALDRSFHANVTVAYFEGAFLRELPITL